MINSKFATLCVAFAVFTASNAYSQNESVILYNSQPVKVELSEAGKIQAFVGVVPGYMEGYDITNESIKVAPTKIEEPILNPTAKNAGYSIVSAERIVLNYKPNYATLDKAIINELNKIAAKLKSDPKTNLLLTANTASSGSDKLSTNRLASIKAYLGIKGIHIDRIETIIEEGQNLLDEVAINYVN